jgi:uncharacterized membrane protein YczE
MAKCRDDAKRVARLFFGLFLYAVGIVMTIHANIGAGPWDVFHLGLVRHLGISLGSASIATSVVLVTVSAVMREHVGFGTLCNMIFIGVFVDMVVASGFVPVLNSLPLGIHMLVGGLFVISLASVFYMGAGYGAGPRDSLMVVLAKRTGRTAGFCRGCVEGAVLIAGWLLGGKVGVGTVISVVGIGFAIQIVFGLSRFDVREIEQESFRETFSRFCRRK